MFKGHPNLFLRYGTALASIALATWVRVLLAPVLGDDYPFSTLFFAVMFTAWYGGFGPAAAATVLGAFSAAYFFILAPGQFFPQDTSQHVGMGLYLSVSLGFAFLGGEIRSSRRRAEDRQRQLEQENDERRRAEDALRRSEQRYRSFVTASAQVVWVTNGDGELVEDMPEWQAYTGQSAAEARGLGWLAAIRPEDHARVRAAWRQAITTRSPYAVEYHLQLKDESWRHVQARGVPVLEPDGRIREWVGTCIDVTERRRIEEALQESGKRFQTVIENMSEGVVIANLDGLLLYWNRAALDMHGLSTSEEWCRRLPEFDAYYQLSTLAGQVVPAEDWPLARILRGERLNRHELRVRSLDQGWERTFSYGGSVITDVTGRQVAFLTILDVTRQKQDEQALRQHADELARINRDLAEKNAENEMFVYSVSHDLRSPLVNLQGFSKELDRGCQALATLFADESFPPAACQQGTALLNGKMAKSLGFIQTAVLRLSGIIDALLRLSRAGRVEYRWETVDVARLVERVNGAAQGTITERGVRVTVGELPPATGDKAALEQVFANLLGNALTYLDPARPGEIEIGCLPPGHDGVPEGFRAYYVKDNGLGIAEAHRAKIFQVFQRAHPHVGKGEGMGLAIVTRVAERHRGRAWVESEVGKGSTFFVSLPAGAAEDNHEPGTVRGEAPGVRRARK